MIASGEYFKISLRGALGFFFGMKSMTGYGRASAPLGTHTLTVQVSSVNRKTLDLTVKLPREWESLEPLVGELVRRTAVRGKIHGRPNSAV